MKKISPRKPPSQDRSRQMVNDILEASIRILKANGGLSFTTIKVAKAAGISVGSLYQYFPNKDSILFQLQRKEWIETWELIEGVIADKRLSAPRRLEKLVLEFFKTEFYEADLRRAIEEAQVDFEGTKEYLELRLRGQKSMRSFLKELNPKLVNIEFRIDLILTVISKIGEEISMRVKTEKDLEPWAVSIAQMLLHNLEGT